MSVGWFLMLVGVLAIALAAWIFASIPVESQVGVREETFKFLLQVFLVVVLGTIAKMLLDREAAERAKRESEARALQDLVDRMSRVHERTIGLQPMMRLYMRIHKSSGGLGDVSAEDYSWCIGRLNSHLQELKTIQATSRHAAPASHNVPSRLQEAIDYLDEIVSEPGSETQITTGASPKDRITLADVPRFAAFVRSGTASSGRRFEEAMGAALEATRKLMSPPSQARARRSPAAEPAA